MAKPTILNNRKNKSEKFHQGSEVILLDPENFEKNKSNDNNQGIRVLRRAGNNYGRLAETGLVKD